jgi:HK97 family phage major capsid protein
MMSIQALREQRATASAALKKMMDDSAGKPWTADNESTFNAMAADIESIDRQIAAVEKAIKLTAAHRDTIDGLADRGGLKLSEAEAEEERRLGVFNSFLRGGFQSLDVADVQAMQREIKAAQSVGTNSAGGYLVPATIVAQLLVEMKMYGGMRDVATILQTASGEQMSWPTMDDTSNVGELVAENAAAASQDLTFGTVAMSTYKFSSKVFTVPFELLQDSAVDVIPIVNAAAAERIARAQNTFFTTGTGTAQPRGVVTAAALGKTGLVGQTLSVIYDDFVDLEHSIDPAYRAQGCQWMMNDASLKVMKKLKDSQNRPLWLPGLSGLDSGVAAPTFMGYPYVINQDVAVMAANAKSILFGTFKRYMIRDVMAMLMFRFDDSAYIKNGQIGFLMWARAGGNYIGPSSNSIKYYANSAT